MPTYCRVSKERRKFGVGHYQLDVNGGEMLIRFTAFILIICVLLIYGKMGEAHPQQDGIAPPSPAATKYARDPNQPIDEEYTKKIHEYTTEPFFSSPLVDYLPASKTIPTPKEVLGDIAGAPGKLPYSHEVYRYMRMLEKATPRVKVFSIGTTEEGREMIAVAVTSEANPSRLEEKRARQAQRADPRAINMDDPGAGKLGGAPIPIYCISGTIPPPPNRAPAALV